MEVQGYNNNIASLTEVASKRMEQAKSILIKKYTDDFLNFKLRIDKVADVSLQETARHSEELNNRKMELEAVMKSMRVEDGNNETKAQYFAKLDKELRPLYSDLIKDIKWMWTKKNAQEDEKIAFYDKILEVAEPVEEVMQKFVEEIKSLELTMEIEGNIHYRRQLQKKLNNIKVHLRKQLEEVSRKNVENQVFKKSDLKSKSNKSLRYFKGLPEKLVKAYVTTFHAVAKSLIAYNKKLLSLLDDYNGNTKSEYVTLEDRNKIGGEIYRNIICREIISNREDVTELEIIL
jgi:hypothetical protein